MEAEKKRFHSSREERSPSAQQASIATEPKLARFFSVARYFFNLDDGERTIDGLGQWFSNDAVAMQQALRVARELAASKVRSGPLALNDRIEVVDQDGVEVGFVRFRDVVEIKDCSRKKRSWTRSVDYAPKTPG